MTLKMGDYITVLGLAGTVLFAQPVFTWLQLQRFPASITCDVQDIGVSEGRGSPNTPFKDIHFERHGFTNDHGVSNKLVRYRTTFDDNALDRRLLAIYLDINSRTIIAEGSSYFKKSPRLRCGEYVVNPRIRMRA